MEFLVTQDHNRRLHLVRPAAWRVARFAALFMVCLCSASRLSAQSVPANRVKAAFIYNFLKFVEWPPEALPSGSGPVVLCTLGENPLRGALDEELKGRTVADHRLVIRHIDTPEAARTCQALFIEQSESRRLKEILASLVGASVLTIGETPEFLRHGGCINLLVESDRVRFSVALPATRNAHLIVSSKLLALALEVEK